jgi:outer membrane lipoprotein-sorting protein
MKRLLLIFLSVYAFSFELKFHKFISDFNQSVKSENKTINYQGKVFVNNELIFWHYEKPIEKKIWITYNKIYVYEPDLEQVTIYNTSKKDNFFILIKSAKKLKNNLYLKEYDNKKIYFETKNGLINKIYYKDKVDNLVTLIFIKQKKKI